MIDKCTLIRGKTRNLIMRCYALSMSTERSDRTKGITLQKVILDGTLEVTELMIMRSGKPLQEIVMNYCPFCGQPVNPQLLDDVKPAALAGNRP